MTLLIRPGRDPAENWINAIRKEIPDLECRIWPETGDRADIRFIIANDMPEGEFATFPNLSFVAGTAVGVERLLRDKALPARVPILRQANPERAATMTAWVLYHVLRHHRRFDEYRANQAARKWEPLRYPPPENVRIGVMGLGNLGGAVARALRDLRYTVAGWTRSRHDMDGIESFAGPAEFEAFLRRSDVVVSILPNTQGTKRLLDRPHLEMLPRGAFVVNAGRGTLIDEKALLDLMESGHIAGAALDVYAEEPLPENHPFWSHPRVTMTPHNACMGRAAYSAGLIVDAIRRVRAGEPLLHVVDKTEGY